MTDPRPADQAKRGLLVSLDEHPAQILRNAETLGLNLRAHVDAGTVQVLYESPQEFDLDAHFARLIQTIEASQIERLVIDGMTSYSAALGEKGKGMAVNGERRHGARRARRAAAACG